MKRYNLRMRRISNPDEHVVQFKRYRFEPVCPVWSRSEALLHRDEGLWSTLGHDGKFPRQVLFVPSFQSVVFVPLAFFLTSLALSVSLCRQQIRCAVFPFLFADGMSGQHNFSDLGARRDL